MGKRTGQHPPRPLPRADCITVWRVALEVEPELLSQYKTVLSEDERRRSAQYRFPRDRRRFIACHAALREILSAYLGLPADQIRFIAGPYGKPALENAAPALHFNLSHAHELALIAVAGREVGVDVEYLAAAVALDDIARSCCTPRELQAAVGLPAGALAYWTCKEAYLKGIGTGLSVSPTEIELHPPPTGTTRTGIAGDSAWSIYPFTPALDYYAAVAACGDDWQMECCDWSVMSHPD